MEKRGETPLSSTLETLGADHDIARLTIAGQVAAAMTAAHTVGLVHGDFCLRAVRVRPDQTVVIDFSGVDATSGAEAKRRVSRTATGRRNFGQEPRPTCRRTSTPSRRSSSRSLLTPTSRSRRPIRCPRAAMFDEVLSRIAASNRQAEPATRAVVEIIREALEREPADRPSAREIARRLKDLLAVLQRQEADRVNASTQMAQTSVMPGADPEGLDSTNCLQVNVVGGFLAANPAAMGRTDRLGRYRILEKIGQGGMGAVFKAEDKADGTIVALKRLNPGISADRQSLHRFQKEARLLAEARHPNIANLLEINEDQGMHYLVMEYVSGTDLKHALLEALAA